MKPYIIQIICAFSICFSLHCAEEMEKKRSDVTDADRRAHRECLSSIYNRSTTKSIATITLHTLRRPQLFAAAPSPEQSLLYAAAQTRSYELFDLILKDDTDDSRRIRTLELGIRQADLRVVEKLKNYINQIRMFTPSFLTIAARSFYNEKNSCCGEDWFKGARTVFELVLNHNNERREQQEALEYGASVADPEIIQALLMKKAPFKKETLLQLVGAAPQLPLTGGGFCRIVCCCCWGCRCCSQPCCPYDPCNNYPEAVRIISEAQEPPAEVMED